MSKRSLDGACDIKVFNFNSFTKTTFKFKEAPKLAVHEIDFDVTDPDTLFLQRHVRVKKGSWDLLPKRLQSDGDETQ